MLVFPRISFEIEVPKTLGAVRDILVSNTEPKASFRTLPAGKVFEGTVGKTDFRVREVNDPSRWTQPYPHLMLVGVLSATQDGTKISLHTQPSRWELFWWWVLGGPILIEMSVCLVTVPLGIVQPTFGMLALPALGLIFWVWVRWRFQEGASQAKWLLQKLLTERTKEATDV